MCIIVLSPESPPQTLFTCFSSLCLQLPADTQQFLSFREYALVTANLQTRPTTLHTIHHERYQGPQADSPAYDSLPRQAHCAFSYVPLRCSTAIVPMANGYLQMLTILPMLIQHLQPMSFPLHSPHTAKRLNNMDL